MKTNIRQSVFETNSSSVHSLSVDKKNLVQRPEQMYGDFGQFGWGPDIVSTPGDKLCYVLTAIANINEIQNIEELFEIEYFKWLDEMVLEYIGNPISFQEWQDSESIWKFGYIDHQSWVDKCPEPLLNFWSDYKEKFQDGMRDFIFNSKYEVIIDNDNH